MTSPEKTIYAQPYADSDEGKRGHITSGWKEGGLYTGYEADGAVRQTRVLRPIDGGDVLAVPRDKHERLQKIMAILATKYNNMPGSEVSISSDSQTVLEDTIRRPARADDHPSSSGGYEHMFDDDAPIRSVEDAAVRDQDPDGFNALRRAREASDREAAANAAYKRSEMGWTPHPR